MNIKERLDTDLKTAMFAHDEEQTSLLRMLKSALRNAEISLKHEVSEDESFIVLEKQAKQRRDSIEQYKAGNRQDLADKEARELALITKYLPEKLSIEEVQVLVSEAITELAAASAADMGRVIQAVMTKAGGTADGKTVSTIVREKLI